MFVCAPSLIGNHAKPSGFSGLVLPGMIVFGRDAGRTMTDDLLGGHEVILVDEVADVGPAEIVPAEVLQPRLQSALFQDLYQ